MLVLLIVCGLNDCIGQKDLVNADSVKIPDNFLLKSSADRKDWFLLNPLSDSIAGISWYKAKELLKGRAALPVIVAVIDNGVDIRHKGLAGNIWINMKEIPGNSIDDDHNGYIDDVHGWNFRGRADGTIVDNEQAGATQFYIAYRNKYEGVDTIQLDSATKKEWAIYQRAKNEYLDKISTSKDSIELHFGYNLLYHSAASVAGKEGYSTDPYYGSPMIKLNSNLSHGTHVAGIICTIAGNVRIMPLVAGTGSGDERDEDVANAIRYAVDNGARIINISFSKKYSANKQLVDEAIRYADSHSVLIIHCAGNDGVNLDDPVNVHFPIPYFENGNRALNYITVGWNRPLFNYRLAHPYSDYGKQTVDLFAPGTDIWSTVPGDGYDFKSGSSMSTPVVSGVAALILSYFPGLSASELKNILLRSSFKPIFTVNKPQTSDPVAFSTLSVSGGIVNAYRAIELVLVNLAER